MIRSVILGATLSGMLAFSSAQAAQAQECTKPRAREHFAGQVVRVYDGDTLTLQRSGCGNINVRLQNWNAPELKEPFGWTQREALTSLAKYRRAQCVVVRGRRGYSSHGRPIARCSVRGRDLGESMRGLGFAEGGR